MSCYYNDLGPVIIKDAQMQPYTHMHIVKLNIHVLYNVLFPRMTSNYVDIMYTHVLTQCQHMPPE